LVAHLLRHTRREAARRIVETGWAVEYDAWHSSFLMKLACPWEL
jgi:hypothetical protein